MTDTSCETIAQSSSAKAAHLPAWSSRSLRGTPFSMRRTSGTVARSSRVTFMGDSFIGRTALPVANLLVPRRLGSPVTARAEPWRREIKMLCSRLFAVGSKMGPQSWPRASRKSWRMSCSGTNQFAEGLAGSGCPTCQYSSSGGDRECSGSCNIAQTLDRDCSTSQ